MRESQAPSTWRTWSREETCNPTQYVVATTVDAVCSAVSTAGHHGKAVRPVGSGWSFNDLTMTDDVLVDLRRLTGTISIGADTATVWAGTTIREVNAALASRGRALRNLGGVDAQTIAGAISTGTHGTGIDLPNLASQVTGMTIVRADGEVETLTDDDGDRLRAFRCGLGALGIIVSVTVRTEPAYLVHSRFYRADVTAVLAGLDALVADHRHVEVLAYAHSKEVIVRVHDICPAEADQVGRHHRIRPRPRLSLSNRVRPHLGRAASWIVPRAIPVINRSVVAGFPLVDAVGPSDRMLIGPVPARGVSAEWSLPVESATAATREVLDRIHADGLHVTGPVQVRFGPGDHDALLSTSFGRATAYLGTTVRARPRQAQRVYSAFQHVGVGVGGRPHWGKRHSLRHTDLVDLYPEWDSFQALRAELDPERRFANPYLRELLGP